MFAKMSSGTGMMTKAWQLGPSFDSNFAGRCLAQQSQALRLVKAMPLTFHFEQVTLPNHGAVARALLVHSIYCSGFLLCRVIRVRTTRLYQWMSEGIRPGKIIRREADGESREIEEAALIFIRRTPLRLERQCSLYRARRPGTCGSPRVQSRRNRE